MFLSVVSTHTFLTMNLVEHLFMWLRTVVYLYSPCGQLVNDFNVFTRLSFVFCFAYSLFCYETLKIFPFSQIYLFFYTRYKERHVPGKNEAYLPPIFRTVRTCTEGREGESAQCSLHPPADSSLGALRLPRRPLSRSDSGGCIESQNVWKQ